MSLMLQSLQKTKGILRYWYLWILPFFSVKLLSLLGNSLINGMSVVGSTGMRPFDILLILAAFYVSRVAWKALQGERVSFATYVQKISGRRLSRLFGAVLFFVGIVALCGMLTVGLCVLFQNYFMIVQSIFISFVIAACVLMFYIVYIPVEIAVGNSSSLRGAIRAGVSTSANNKMVTAGTFLILFITGALFYIPTLIVNSFMVEVIVSSMQSAFATLFWVTTYHTITYDM